MNKAVFSEILQGIYDNEVVPYLGPGVLFDVTDKLTGAPIPANSDSLILAMNNGKPIAPVIDDFPRAVMDLESKHGRGFVTQFLDKTYKKRQWTRAVIHDWLVEWRPDYVVDINRDTQLLESYADEEHSLIVGVARVAGSGYCFKTYSYNDEEYAEVEQRQVDPTFPMLFKPMGCPIPKPNYIVSEADYVDYIAGLKAGLAIPDFLREYRKGKKYVLLGVPLNSDYECMVLSELVCDANEPKGWFLCKNSSLKEKRFAESLGFKLVKADCLDFIDFLQHRKVTRV